MIEVLSQGVSSENGLNTAIACWSRCMGIGRCEYGMGEPNAAGRYQVKGQAVHAAAVCQNAAPLPYDPEQRIREDRMVFRIVKFALSHPIQSGKELPTLDHSIGVPTANLLQFTHTALNTQAAHGCALKAHPNTSLTNSSGSLLIGATYA